MTAPEIRCPRCGGTDLFSYQYWTGADYSCNTCHHAFKMVPGVLGPDGPRVAKDNPPLPSAEIVPLRVNVACPFCKTAQTCPHNGQRVWPTAAIHLSAGAHACESCGKPFEIREPSFPLRTRSNRVCDYDGCDGRDVRGRAVPVCDRHAAAQDREIARYGWAYDTHTGRMEESAVHEPEER